MGKTQSVMSAVESDQIVVACAYRGHVASEVLAALPPGFNHVRYVAKFVDGKMVELRPGTPETVIAGMLGAQVDGPKSCDAGTCIDPNGAESPTP